MQREGLIVFALLLTLAVLAPQGGSANEAAAQGSVAAPLDAPQPPAMTLSGPATPGEDCELEYRDAGASQSDVQLEFRVNVSI